jgi:hypothetical protein
MELIESKTGEPGDETDQTPFPPERVRKLLLALKVSLGRGRGAPLSFEDWGELVARPGNTLSSWCADGRASQLQALLASLERLPEPERQQLIEEACRPYPTLRHRRLAHDFVVVSNLAALLRQASGLTAIQGSQDHLRTFLLTALGHSFPEFGASGAPVAGLDVHRPDFFVPVVGLVYLNGPLTPTETARQILRAWPTVRSATDGLVLLNGIWSKAPELQPQIVDLAHRAHVIVADPVVFPLKPSSKMLPSPLHLLTVSPARECPEWLHVEVQAP